MVFREEKNQILTIKIFGDLTPELRSEFRAAYEITNGLNTIIVELLHAEKISISGVDLLVMMHDFHPSSELKLHCNKVVFNSLKKYPIENYFDIECVK